MQADTEEKGTKKSRKKVVTGQMAKKCERNGKKWLCAKASGRKEKIVFIFLPLALSLLCQSF